MNQISDEYDYVDWGCGFPVVLARVGVVPYGKKDTIPLVPYHIVEAQVRRALIEKPTRLTGRELRFTRICQELRLVEFGKLFDVTHPAVKKWEAKKDSATGMAWGTEVLVRLWLLECLGGKSRDIAAAYKRLKTPLPAGPCTIRLDLDCQPVKIEYDEHPLAEAS